jgi:hypothetical protein
LSSYGITRNRTNVLPIVIGITIFLSLVPASWLGWTSDIAALVRVPVTPISHIGILFTSWVRPSLEPSDFPTDEKERNDLAIAERDHYRQLYHAQMLRATELADQLRELQALPESALRNPQPPLIIQVDVTGNRPSAVSGTIELKLIREATSRIRVGDIAIVGRDIVGRISSIGRTKIDMKPTTNKDMGLTRAAIVPAHPTSERSPLLAEIVLQSNGDAIMIAEVAATSGVRKGDLVQLDDPSWPQVGAGLTLGMVEEIVPLDEAPLRQRVIVVPRRLVRDVSRVVVLGTGKGRPE